MLTRFITVVLTHLTVAIISRLRTEGTSSVSVTWVALDSGMLLFRCTWVESRLKESATLLFAPRADKSFHHHRYGEEDR